MTMPRRWAEGGWPDFAGRARFRRHFSFPAQLDAHERVWLTFEGVHVSADVTLNGAALGHSANGPFEFEVTALLHSRNELLVEVEGPTDGGLWGEVALEIRCPAFLRDIVSHWENGRLRVSGVAAGCAERLLEWYVLLDGSTVGYGTIEPTAAGTPFAVLADEKSAKPDAEERHLRVDLVNGGSLWYQFDKLIPRERRQEA